MAPGTNPTTLKVRGGRLSAFARNNSESLVHRRSSSPKPDEPEPRSATPHINEPALSRQEIADNAKLPIPQSGRARAVNPRPTRQALLGNNSPLKIMGPPEKAEAPSPSKDFGALVRRNENEEHRRDLFEGSQLGEQFMGSGLTTPQNEIEDTHFNADDEVKQGNALQLITKSFVHPPPRKPSRIDFDLFQVGEDGFIEVSDGGRRRSPTHVKDSFQPSKTHAVDWRKDDQWPESPVDKSRKYPLREVRVRRAQPTAKGVRGTPSRPQTPPAYEEWRQQPQSKHKIQDPSVLDDSGDERISASDAGAHETPKPARDDTVRLGSPLERSRSPTAVMRNRIRGQKRPRPSTDYDDVALSSMTFAKLQDEPFDLDPAKAATQNGHGADSDQLSTKLEQQRHRPDRDQEAFFTSMSMDDWEDSGDWFVDEFAKLMKTLRDARRGKRQVIRQFEEEAAHREEAVRLRFEAIDRKLGKMRQEGRRVVGGEATAD